MKYLFWLTIVFLSTNETNAQELLANTIINIDYPRTGETDIHLYLANGRVLRMKNSLKPLWRKLETKYRLNQLTSNKSTLFTAKKDYEPSVLTSEANIINLFNSMRKDSAKRSQCHNRAHVWAYELKQKFNLKSLKRFMFYTRRYIREYHYKWWYHVAPSTLLDKESTVEERVLDPRFTMGPLKLNEWASLFMRKGMSCPEIKNYSEYFNNQETNYCYLHKTSMYYVQPLDLDRLERYGEEKATWIDNEVKRAYRNFFDVW